MTHRQDRQRSTVVNRPVVAPSQTPRATENEGLVPPTASSGTSTPRAMTLLRGGVADELPLLDGERYVLGRHDAADVVFDDAAVSRLHGVLAWVDGRWCFEDYGSQNGTRLVRGASVVDLVPHEPIIVAAGDVLELGGGASRVQFTAQVREREERERGCEVSAAARDFAMRLRLAGRTRVPVFLLGASGVGKTWSARRIHELSRSPGAFVPVNCARLPLDPTALHSELLGHVRGAYTGAESARTGKLVLADGGTLFLDEVERLPPSAQGFLLDVLEGSGDLAPLGAGAMRLKPLTFRLISASKKPLAQSGLRADLCERLAEGHLWRVPGLAERTADIPGLLAHFAREQSGLLGVDVVIAPSAVRFAQRARWPGEVRMLRSAVTALAQLGLARRAEAAASVNGRARGPIELRDVDFETHLAERSAVFGGDDDGIPTRGDARRLTKAQIEAALAAAGGNQVQAARALGIARNTLRRRLAAA